MSSRGATERTFGTVWATSPPPRRLVCPDDLTRPFVSVATQVGTSDIGWHWTINEQGGVPPWEDVARYVQRSPVTYADQIRTPLLLVHGESDLRCNIVESEQMFVALKKLGRTVTSATGSSSTGSRSILPPRAEVTARRRPAAP